MPDEIPLLSLGLGEQDENLVLIDTTDEAAVGEVATMADLLRQVPGLASEAHALDLARAVNHFKHGADYRVIENPTEFTEAYRAQIEREDPAAQWQENVVRLRDFGLPDFSQIEPPKFAGGQLTFYAADNFLGVPYKVQTPNLEATPTYTPMPLTPLPSPPAREFEEEDEEFEPASELPAKEEPSAAPADSPEAWLAAHPAPPAAPEEAEEEEEEGDEA